MISEATAASTGRLSSRGGKYGSVTPLLARHSVSTDMANLGVYRARAEHSLQAQIAQPLLRSDSRHIGGYFANHTARADIGITVQMYSLIPKWLHIIV